MLKTYDPKKVFVFVGGVPMSGFPDGSFITVDYVEDRFKPTTGCDGGVSRSKSANYSATVKLTLMATSGSNDVLAGFHLRDILANAGVVDFMMKEANGTTLVHAPESFISKPPSVEYGKDVGSREWSIFLAEADIHVGGVVV